tara:strand:- start:554 stop:781 length:228 start_codon:yes stop_codon:yes gene_type:complete
MERNDIPSLYVESNDDKCDDISIIRKDNEILKKQQIKYRNIVNNLRFDNNELRKEINRLIDENVKLVDRIKEKHN